MSRARVWRTSLPNALRLRLDCLEDRSVPAGNVLAEQAGSILTLIGDELGNHVQLLPGSQAGEVVVVGAGGTTVNGAEQQVFSGVENLFAHLLDGDDRLTVQGVVIDAPSFSSVFVDGNAGNDQIELIDSTIRAVNSVDVLIYGERVIGGFASGTTGNDTIQIQGTTITSKAFVSVKIYGETNEGGEVTEGNDTITIADSTISATGGFFHHLSLEIIGDLNSSLGGQTSTIGGGNDTITFRNSTISAEGGQFGSNQVTATIIGDFNLANNFPAGDATSTIGGGDDSIAIQNTTFAATGQAFAVNQVGLTISGDRSFAGGFVAGATTTATIGSGNDSIVIADSAVTATGGVFGNGAFVEITGDHIQSGGPAGGTTMANIGGGSDSIVVRNTTIAVDGPASDGSALFIRGENLTLAGAGLAAWARGPT